MAHALLQVFSHHLSLASVPIAALAAELVQQPFEGPNAWEASGPSPLKQLHVQLLTLVGSWQAYQPGGNQSGRTTAYYCSA